jgi:hypothetical protein
MGYHEDNIWIMKPPKQQDYYNFQFISPIA